MMLYCFSTVFGRRIIRRVSQSSMKLTLSHLPCNCRGRSKRSISSVAAITGREPGTFKHRYEHLAKLPVRATNKPRFKLVCPVVAGAAVSHRYLLQRRLLVGHQVNRCVHLITVLSLATKCYTWSLGSPMIPGDTGSSLRDSRHQLTKTAYGSQSQFR